MQFPPQTVSLVTPILKESRKVVGRCFHRAVAQAVSASGHSGYVQKIWEQSLKAGIDWEPERTLKPGRVCSSNFPLKVFSFTS